MLFSDDCCVVSMVVLLASFAWWACLVRMSLSATRPICAGFVIVTDPMLLSHISKAGRSHDPAGLLQSNSCNEYLSKLNLCCMAPWSATQALQAGVGRRCSAWLHRGILGGMNEDSFFTIPNSPRPELELVGPHLLHITAKGCQNKYSHWESIIKFFYMDKYVFFLLRGEFYMTSPTASFSQPVQAFSAFVQRSASLLEGMHHAVKVLLVP